MMDMQTEIRTEELRARHEVLWNHEVPFRQQHNPGLALRTYRAIDWTHRARMEHSDHFAAFLFYWIAFNALYGAETHSDDPEGNWDARRRFFDQLTAIDGGRSVLERLRVLEKQAAALVGNALAYRPDDVPDVEALQGRAARFRNLVRKGRTAEALGRVFDGLNRVRNWLVHGGVAWRSRVMASTLADGTVLLTWLVPTFIETMLAAHDALEWEMPPLTHDFYEERTSAKDIPALDTPALRR